MPAYILDDATIEERFLAALGMTAGKGPRQDGYLKVAATTKALS
jgi:hypothetical protein